MELGRWDLALRMGLAKVMLKERCVGILGEVIEEQRHSVNLDLAVRFNGVDDVVSIRAAFLPARGLTEHMTQPAYLRVVLGRPEGEPSRWAAWDKVWFPRSSRYSPAPESLTRVVHEAMGTAGSRRG